MALYTPNDKVMINDNMMDYLKQVNKIPYEEYGDMIASGELVVIRISYNEAYTMVVDRDGSQWKVTYQQDGFLAVLTKVD